jgi:hypothetical protein
MYEDASRSIWNRSQRRKQVDNSNPNALTTQRHNLRKMDVSKGT